MTRRSDIDGFYSILDELRSRLGGFRYLARCDGHLGWPRRGVYFFFEPGELREDGRTLRVVRVGTHAVSVGSRTTLWGRLSQHRGRTAGRMPGGGNHRGSIFRLHVGTALLRAYPERYGSARETWGRGMSAPREVREAEYPLERAVSTYIGGMPLLWIEADDMPGTTSVRGPLEMNAVALLSNAGKEPVDPRSQSWLGRYSERQAIRESGLWNVNYVNGAHDPQWLGQLASSVRSIVVRS